MDVSETRLSTRMCLEGSEFCLVHDCYSDRQRNSQVTAVPQKQRRMLKFPSDLW